MEADALFGIESGGGLVDDDEARIAEESLRNAEALLHAAGVSAERFAAVVVEIGLLEKRADDFFALVGVGDAFEDGEVVEEIFGGDFGVEAELLREVSEDAADRVFLAEDVDVAERGAAGVGFLQRGEGAHEGGLPCTVWAEQAEHAEGDGEGDVLKSLRAVGVALGEVGDLEVHEGFDCKSGYGGSGGKVSLGGLGRARLRGCEVARFQGFKVSGADRISESLLSSGVNGFPAVVRNPVEAAGRAGGMGSFDSFGWRLSSLRMTEYFWELLFA